MKDFYRWPLAVAALAAVPVAATIALAPAATADTGESSTSDSSGSSDSHSSPDGGDEEEDDITDTDDERDRSTEVEDTTEVDDTESGDEQEVVDEIESATDDPGDSAAAGSGDDATEPEPEPAPAVDIAPGNDSARDERYVEVTPPSATEMPTGAELADSSTTTVVDVVAPEPAPRAAIVPGDASQQVLATTSATATTLASSKPVEVAVAVTQKAFTVTTEIIATLALPFMGWIPEDVPASQSPLLALLGWVRREFEYIAYDLGPTSEPNQMLQDTENSNVIMGTMMAQGVHNEPGEHQVPLSYTVIQQGVNGVGAVDENGNWLYTPNADSPGGPDTFVVQIEDDGFHLDNLVGLPGHTTTVTVNVMDTVSGQADPEPGSSLGTYYIYNLTSSTVNLVWVGQSDPGTSEDNSTNVLAILESGQTWAYVMGNNDAHYAVLRTTDTDQIYHVKVQTYRPANGEPDSNYASCSASGNGASCTPSSKTITNDVILLDAPGTVVTIPASETQEQNETLDNLCDDPNVDCVWDIDGRTYYLATGAYPQTYTNNGGQVLTFSPVKNSSTNPNDSVTLEYSYTYGTSSSQSWSVSESVEASLLDVVTDTVTTEYGQSTSVDNSWTESIDLTVSPGETGYIFYQAPMYDIQGDFVITSGNTKWYIEDTHYYTTATDQVGLWTAESSATPVTPPAEVYPAG